MKTAGKRGPRHRRRKPCAKQRFATRKEAEQQIQAMDRKWRPVYKHAYWCARCKAWHLTGTPPNLVARKRRKR